MSTGKRPKQEPEQRPEQELEQRPEVSVRPTADYEAETIRLAIGQHMAALDFAKYLTPTTKVVLKPNLLMKRTPEQGTTTHPAVVRGVIDWLEEQGVSHITIVDSPGGPYTTPLLQGIYKTSGLEKAILGTTALLNYNTDYQTVAHPEGVLCREFSVINPILEADLIINLPKLKTHGMMQLSAGVKNLFGVVPGLQKSELHFRFPNPQEFAQMLVDLSTLIKPTLTIVDAVVSMEGDGPSAGDLRSTGYTFAAYDVHALDVALCSFIGMPHATAFTVAKSVAQGLAPATAEAIDYLGHSLPVLDDFAQATSRPVDFMQWAPKFLWRPATFFGEKLLSPRPVIEKKECIGCGKCAESCAAKAVLIEGKLAKITYSKCIKCYCCHEMCPVKAIRIRRGFVLSRL